MPSPIPEGTAHPAPGAPNLQCESCGYDIRGLTAADRCPECGIRAAESMPERRIGTPWQRGAGLTNYIATLTGTIVRPSSLLRFASRQPGKDFCFYMLNALLSAAMPIAVTSTFILLNSAGLGEDGFHPIGAVFFFLIMTIVCTFTIAFTALIIFYAAWAAAAITTRRFTSDEGLPAAAAASAWLVLGSATCAISVALSALIGPLPLILFPVGLLLGWIGYAVTCYRGLLILRFANWPPAPAQTPETPRDPPPQPPTITSNEPTPSNPSHLHR